MELVLFTIVVRIWALVSIKIQGISLYCTMSHFFLIYSSVPSRVLTDKEVEDLLTVSRKENEIHNITGMLLCLPETYIQLIEGPENEIRQLYQNLIKDRRHHKVITLKEGIIEKRFFPDWSMGYDKRNISVKNQHGAFDFSEEKVFELFDILNEGE